VSEANETTTIPDDERAPDFQSTAEGKALLRELARLMAIIQEATDETATRNREGGEHAA
jgi:hypothetical protein